MKKLGIAALAVAAAIGLSGCENAVKDRQATSDFSEDGFMKTRTGEEVYCIFYSRGLACDFGNELGLNKK